MIIQLSARYIPNHLTFPTSVSYQLMNRGDVVWSNSYVLLSEKSTVPTIGTKAIYLTEHVSLLNET